MQSASATGWAPAPWFLTRPPEGADHLVERSRLRALLDDLVPGHRVTVITAPAGFGKTTALAEWVRHRTEPTAWLSLTRFDQHTAHLLDGVVTALHRRAPDDDERWMPLLTLGSDHRDLAAAYGAVVRALEAVPGPTVLVVDDVHRAGPDVADGILGMLAAHAPASFHLVLAGREVPALPLQRLSMAGQLGEVGPADLRFTRDETMQASVALHRQVSEHVTESVWREADGWPAAVRMALVVPDAKVRSGLADYVAEEILAGLRPELADFVLAATTCDTLDPALGTVLSGRRSSAGLLEECVRLGLFLDRFADDARTPVYRWHAIFADQCRAILSREDPDRADRLHRVAARHLAPTFPLRAVVHAQRARDPGLALHLLEEHWLRLVLGGDVAAVEQLCLNLPEPWIDAPSALLLRACCRDVRRDRPAAAALFARADAEAQRGGIDGTPQFQTARALTQLFLADDQANLCAACDRIGELLRTSSGWGPAMHACVTFLLGWTELRLRRRPADAARILRTAEWECAATGEETVRRRAAANLGFALAFSGALREAREVLDPAVGNGSGPTNWTSADTGVEWLTDGFIAYWSDDLERARRSLKIASDCSDNPYSFAALGRVYQAFTAASRAVDDELREAETALQKVADVEAHGVPWHLYQRVARAMLHLAGGRPDGARAVLRGIGDPGTAPVSIVLAAEVLRRIGDRDGALRLLDQLPPSDAAYVVASARVTRALAARKPEMALHAALEEALAVAAPEGVVRPFTAPDPVLRDALVEHARWGTRHAEFLAVCIAHLDATTAPDGPALSPREREILDFLRTPMTVEEIAAALYLSVNTVKTHQRALYRKLGVRSRREAVRAAR